MLSFSKDTLNNKSDKDIYNVLQTNKKKTNYFLNITLFTKFVNKKNAALVSIRDFF